MMQTRSGASEVEPDKKKGPVVADRAYKSLGEDAYKAQLKWGRMKYCASAKRTFYVANNATS
jgi:hypothetical protein